ncbi:type 1 glutamine amidotransferase family protein [Anoxynatronum buryatiense]|uniref:Intracellular protease/amidase n=1 Tax=Anoxynatronum buryatiense TaxID=489973 RepID=A0AA46AJS0_9CLOT|nr:type 1 glutamine amidotransferase family protein [Anoxynatronum buryatiense]SMP63802.1 Putative intracellular protease/amidase [Anoxynatronum buryatiense]
MTNELSCQKGYIYVLDTLADWEIGFITAELNSGRYFAENTKFELIMIGNSLKPIKTMGGITITPDMDINQVIFKEGDLLVLPGADTWMDEKNKNILEMVSNVINQKVIVAAICGATAALAQNGLLDNRKHTSNDKDYLKMSCPGYAGSHHYINAATVVDDNVITATGLAPLEFAYEVFKKIKVMKSDTVEAWYHLYQTRESRYFYSLMESMESTESME